METATIQPKDFEIVKKPNGDFDVVVINYMLQSQV
jgi:hypothetical protein